MELRPTRDTSSASSMFSFSRSALPGRSPTPSYLDRLGREGQKSRYRRATTRLMTGGPRSLEALLLSFKSPGAAEEGSIVLRNAVARDFEGERIASAGDCLPSSRGRQNGRLQPPRCAISSSDGGQGLVMAAALRAEPTRQSVHCPAVIATISTSESSCPKDERHYQDRPRILPLP